VLPRVVCVALRLAAVHHIVSRGMRWGDSSKHTSKTQTAAHYVFPPKKNTILSLGLTKMISAADGLMP